MGKAQSDSLFVFDEPTIGLHPADVQVLLGVFQTLIEHGATVIVIEHDLDVIRNADYIIDMGPGGGAQGGTVVAAGTPDVIRHTLKRGISSAIGYSSVLAAANLKAKAIITPTVSGATARVMSNLKPIQPIIGVTPSERALRRMSIYCAHFQDQL